MLMVYDIDSDAGCGKYYILLLCEFSRLALFFSKRFVYKRAVFHVGTMEYRTQCRRNNQNYICKEYDIFGSLCPVITKCNVYGNKHIFELPEGHSIMIEFETMNKIIYTPFVDISSVHVDDNFQMIPMVPVSNIRGVGHFVPLQMNGKFNAIAFSVNNYKPICFVIRPPQVPAPVETMSSALSMYPGAAGKAIASYVPSRMNSDTSNSTHEHMAHYHKQLVNDIRGRVYDYYVTQGKLSDTECEDILRLIR